MSSSTQNDLQSELNNSEIRNIVDRLSNPQNEYGAHYIQPDTDDAERYLPSPPPRRPTIFVFPLLPQVITLKELNIIKLTAQFVSVYGMFFRRDLMQSVSTNPLYESQFQFMNDRDSRHPFYVLLVCNYSSVLFRSEKVRNPRKGGASSETFLEGLFNLLRQVLEKDKEEGVEVAMIDLYALEYFFNKEGPPPENLATMMNQAPQMQPPLGSHGIQPDAPATDLQPPPREPNRFEFSLVLPEGFTLEGLNIIRLTAQFAAFFGLDLMYGVMMDFPFYHLFEFMLQPSSRNRFFRCLYHMYKRVLKSSSKLSTSPCTKAVGEKFFNLVRQVLEKEVEVGVEMAMIDSHAFEYFANLEWMKLGPSPGNLSIPRNPPPQMQPPLGSQYIQPDAPATPPPRKPSIFVVLLLPQGFTTLEDLPSPHPRRTTIFVFPLLPQGITLKELNIIKLTAQFVSVYGMFFRRDLMQSVSTNPLYESQFQFMNDRDSRHPFYVLLVCNYSSVLFRSEKVKNPRKGGASSETFLEGFFNLLRQVLEKDKEGVEMAMIDLYAVEYFFNKEVPPPENLAMMMNQPPQMQPPLGSHGIQPDAPATDLQPPPREPNRFEFSLVLPEGFTLEELNIIRLTAQFAAFFGLDLMYGVMMDLHFYHQFEFMLQPSSSRSRFFDCLYHMYKRVLKSSSKLSTSPCTKAVGEKYSSLVCQVIEKVVEVGVERAMIDSHAFEYFANMEWMNPPLQMKPPLGSGSAPRPRMSPRPSLPLPEEPDPKRGNFDESALVPEDQFIAQHPGSSTIRGSVENIKNGQLIEITLQSLSENVASLKEKISGKIQIPAKRQRLCGIAGFLKDNMSLAHYNVRAGEVLTLCLNVACG